MPLGRHLHGLPLAARAAAAHAAAATATLVAANPNRFGVGLSWACTASVSAAHTAARAAAGAGITAPYAVAALAAELAHHLPRAAVHAGALSLYRFDRQAVVLERLLEQRCLFAERGRPLRGLLHRSGRGCG